MTEDTTPVALHRWCAAQLALQPDTVPSLSVVSGDASFRRYYRFSPPGRKSLVAVHAPPDKEDNAAFVAVQKLLSEGGVRVPGLLGWEPEQGFLLQEDFGGQLLLSLLDSPEAAELFYYRAFASLRQMQSIRLADGQLPRYDRERLTGEMQLFPQWFCEQLLGHDLAGAEHALLDKVFSVLAESALAQPQVVVHRDFHSRNIMVLDGGELGLIDFQDAVLGPYSYDLVSLLRDCYVHWPQQQVRAWALAYRRQLADTGVAVAAEAEFLRQFDLMGLQRHIKVLGIFARLFLRDGKSAYLDDLPLVLAYTLTVARHYPELSEFVAWFEARLLPLAKQQRWYRDVTL